MIHIRLAAGCVGIGLVVALGWLASGVGAQTKTAGATNTSELRASAGGILYPPDCSILMAEESQVVAVTRNGMADPTITLDGQPLKMARMSFAESWFPGGANTAMNTVDKTDSNGSSTKSLLQNKASIHLLLASVTLKPGKHTLEVDGVPSRIFRSTAKEGSDGPSDWKVFHAHPGIGNTNKPPACLNCHDVKTSGDSEILGLAKLPDTCQVCHTAVDLRLTHSHVMDPLLDCLICHDPHGSAYPSLLINEKAKLCTQCHEAGHSKN